MAGETLETRLVVVHKPPRSTRRIIPLLAYDAVTGEPRPFTKAKGGRASVRFAYKYYGGTQIDMLPKGMGFALPGGHYLLIEREGGQFVEKFDGKDARQRQAVELDREFTLQTSQGKHKFVLKQVVSMAALKKYVSTIALEQDESRRAVMFRKLLDNNVLEKHVRQTLEKTGLRALGGELKKVGNAMAGIPEKQK